MVDLLILLASIAALLFGAHWLVDGASSIAQKLKVSKLIIGLTVVSFGTSAPELVVNIVASFTGNTDLAIGNILGSNTANILLIIGVSALIATLRVNEKVVWREIPIGFIAMVLLALFVLPVMMFKANVAYVSRVEGVIFLVCMLAFLLFSFKTHGNQVVQNGDVSLHSYSIPLSIFYFLLGLGLLILGGKYVVESGTAIARAYGVSESLIGITIIAIGTSLPELATSVIAVMKKNADIAIGNVVGSNIFNILFVLGITASIKPIPFNQALHIDMWMALLAGFLLFFFLFLGKRHQIGWIKGLFFLLLYFSYLGFQIYQNVSS